MAERDIVKEGFSAKDLQEFQRAGLMGGTSIKADDVIVQDTDHEHNRLQEHMREVIKKDWRVYVKVQSYADAYSCLETNNHVTLKGSKGCGKTAMAYQFLRSFVFDESPHCLKLKKDYYDVLIVDEPSDLKHDRDPERPTVVLIDDVFGRDDSLPARSYRWQYCLENELCPLLGYGSKGKSNLKVIFTSQRKCFEEAVEGMAYLRQTIFADNTVFDVTFLTTEEKRSIVEKHKKKAKKNHFDVEEGQLTEICSVETPFGFPRTCQLLFLKQYCPDPVEFFTKLDKT